MNTSRPRVLVAGAGPVGLSLALGLARRGVDVDVYEAEAALSSDPRASKWHPPTLEMFAEFGVADEIIARGAKVDRLQFWERETRTLIAEFRYALLAGDTRYPFRFQCPQYLVTPILLDAIRAAGGRVHFEHRVIDVVEREDGVELRVATPEGERSERGAWLCAADGARSTVRQRLDITLHGKTYEDRFLLAASPYDFGELFPGLGPVAYVFDPEEWIIMMRLPDLVRVVFRLTADEDAETAMGETQLQARFHRLLGRKTDIPIALRSTYSVHQRVADRFRQGRILLLGDAAHLNNPAGGMGMNSGIHDAYLLARTLADHLDGRPESVLDGWAERRRQVATDSVHRTSDKTFRDLTMKGAAERAERNHDLARQAADPVQARAFLLRTAMLDTRESISLP
ncbi:MAG: FAD-dependent monooxygenase [Polyangiaceae bacterium]